MSKKRIVNTTLFLITILWLLFIFTLSSQNGAETAKASEGIAQEVAEIIYKQPTQQQITQVHLNIRKSAHIGLFFILGTLSLLASATIFGWEKKQKYISIVISSMITAGYGFFDEWHKQFIDGRHFQLDEAMLNMVSCIAGVTLAILVIVLFNKKNQNKPNQH